MQSFRPELVPIVGLHARTTAVAIINFLRGASEGQVSRSLTEKTAAGCNGSACASRALDLAAGKLTLKLSHQIADVHGRQWTTHCGHPIYEICGCEAVFG